MSTMRRAPRRGLLLPSVLLLSTSLMLVFLAGAPAPADPTPGPASPSAEKAAAEEALETVETVLGPAEDAAPPAAADPADARAELTSALRDLSALQAHLSPADQRVAARLLARPTDDVNSCVDTDYACFGNVAVLKECAGSLCVRYSVSGPHRVPAENDGAGGSWPGTAGGAPDYVEFTLATLTRIAQRYEAAGYRPVVPDGGTDGTAETDIYLADLGGSAYPVYGYCSSDDTTTQHVAVAAYCVLDNDYRRTQFPLNTAIENLRVTAAHEFFHAVQFAYDYNEDLWFMEASATWAEEALFDGINDNRQYLPAGPLLRPWLLLDSASGYRPYASWIFVQYLAQRFPREQAGMPTIVREIWERLAHSGTGARSMYSVAGIVSALRDRGADATTEFARFTAWNRRPKVFYDEGRAYSPARLSGVYRLGPQATQKRLSFELNHLSARHYRFVSNFSGRKDLRISVNLNSRRAGGFAFVLVKKHGSAPRLHRIPLNTYGNGVLRVRFGSAVDWAEVDAVNASTRYTGCRATSTTRRTTCGGRAVDNRRVQRVVVRAVNR